MGFRVGYYLKTRICCGGWGCEKNQAGFKTSDIYIGVEKTPTHVVTQGEILLQLTTGTICGTTENRTTEQQNGKRDDGTGKSIKMVFKMKLLFWVKTKCSFYNGLQFVPEAVLKVGKWPVKYIKLERSRFIKKGEIEVGTVLGECSASPHFIPWSCRKRTTILTRWPNFPCRRRGGGREGGRTDSASRWLVGSSSNRRSGPGIFFRKLGVCVRM